MLKVNQYNTQNLYLSKRLTVALEQIPQYPLTVIEAPMGYGKTTAVREYAAKTGVNVLWLPVHDSIAVHFWNAFCGLFASLDQACAIKLAELGLPEDSAARREAVLLLGDILFEKTTLLVIDDYHLLTQPAIHDFIAYLSKNKLPNLHLILTTRMVFMDALDELKMKGLAQQITQKLLELTPAEIASYYKSCGIRLKSEEVDTLYTYTEGWISALYLCLLGFLQDGRWERQDNLQELLAKVVYRPLSAELKEFLLHICLFDCVSLSQASAMWRQGNAAALLRQLLSQNAFIQYDNQNQTYQLHNIFTSYLREIFTSLESSYRREIWRAAGQWHLQTGDYLAAMEAFYQANDFDKLLSVLETDKANSFNSQCPEIIQRYFTECPDEIKQKHPVTGVLYAREQVFGNGEQFSLHCQDINRHIDQIADREIKNWIAGEMELVCMLAKYNDIAAMAEHIRRAHELLQGPSTLSDHKTPWTLGAPSVLYMFYRQSGRLQQAVDDLSASMPLYCKITAGHGLGADYTMQAEQHYYCGDFENAEIVSHKALQAAKSGQQICIIVCALFLQVRLALVRGDLTAAQKLLEEMRAEIKKSGQKLYLHTTSLCEGFIYAQLKQPEHIAEWIRTGDFADSHLHLPVMAYFHMIYGRLLLINDEERKLLGMAEHFTNMASLFPNLIGQIYTHIYLAAANEKLFRREAALSALVQALDLAAPDGVAMPFVENADFLHPLLEELSRQGRWHPVMTRIRTLAKPYQQSLLHMTASSLANETRTILTERERQIAYLAADGMTNREIGAALRISENTVKTQLKRVFEKLGLASRAQLQTYLE